MNLGHKSPASTVSLGGSGMLGPANIGPVLELAAPPGQRGAELARRLLPSLGIQPQDLTVAFQLADRIAQQRVKFEKQLAACQKKCSEESVHEARVQCRRLIARLCLVKAAFPSRTVDSVLRSLKRFLKKLGELRDVQVQRLALTDDLSRHPEISGLWIELGRREEELVQQAAETTRRFKIGKLHKRVRALEAELTDPAARLAAKANLSAAIVRALEEAYAEVKGRRLAIKPAVPSTVHRVRIAYKKFRYMVESLPPAIARPSSAQLTAMTDYQGAMGRIQDVEVLDRQVEEYAERFPVAASDLSRFRQVLLERRRLLIDKYLGVADSLPSFWPLRSPPPA